MFRVTILVVLIGIALYINQVVVPATPPLFMPTPTPTHSPESFVNQAQDFFKAGKLDRAIEAYQSAIDSDPANAANYIELARLQIYTRKYTDAITNAQNAQLKNPENPQALAIEGWALGFTGKYGQAEEKIRQSLALDPKNALTHAYYAEILINQGKFELQDKAAQESRAALDLDQNLMETHRARGIVLYNTQNLKEAEDEFKAAINAYKYLSDLYFYLGVTYKADQKYDLAQEALLQAYTLDPKNTDSLIELARSFFADGKYAQAAQYAEEAVRVDPSNPRLHGYLGSSYYKNKEYDKAITELALAVRGGTTTAGTAVQGLPLAYDNGIITYYTHYGLSLAYTGRCAEAVPIFQAMLNGVANDENAVYNAEFGLGICLYTPTPTSKVPQGTPQPGGAEKPAVTATPKP
ncbi:MAG TPA: tetratricopeptide repeat protein [Anaerolineales bacterium]